MRIRTKAQYVNKYLRNLFATGFYREGTWSRPGRMPHRVKHMDKMPKVYTQTLRALGWSEEDDAILSEKLRNLAGK